MGKTLALILPSILTGSKQAFSNTFFVRRTIPKNVNDLFLHKGGGMGEL